MHWSETLWLLAGFTAQAFFSARFLVQWLLSERARRSLMPIHFWYFSVAGAALLLAYAVHQRDPVISVGQLAGLAIYLRNLEFINRERPTERALGWLWPWLGLTAAAVSSGYYLGPDSHARALLLDSFWTVWGFAGQALFTGRFLVQWFHTERAGRSVIPLGFWYLSITGGLMLLAYAVAVMDPVIIFGQAFGVLVYSRNLLLIRRACATGEYSSK
jgi:lipid-A-disaccharide synthase-like uncharacterized protein